MFSCHNSKSPFQLHPSKHSLQVILVLKKRRGSSASFLGTLPCGGEEVGIQVIISCACTSFTESNIIPVDEERRVSINRLQAMFACVGANTRVTSEKENNKLNLIYSIITIDRRKAVTRKTNITK